MSRSPEDLERALRNERAEREAAQRRVAALSEKADVWRQRAEERAARIERLEAERADLMRVTGWVRARAGRTLRARPVEPDRPATVPSTAGPDLPVPSARIGFPSTRVASVGVTDPVLGRVLSQFEVVDAAEDPGSLDRVDFVVRQVGGERPTRGDGAFEEWVSRPGRQPLAEVLIDGPGSPTEVGGRIVRFRPSWSSDGGRDVDAVLPATFDANRWSPAASVTAADLRALAGDDASAVVEEGTELAVTGRRTFSSPWRLAAAASGIPFPDEGELAGGHAMAGALGRRLAYMGHAPWHVAAGMLDRIGISHIEPHPAICATLVSNRPSLVGGAISGITRQIYPHLELVIGCHGFSSSEVADEIAIAADRMPVTVVDFESDLSLGRCLNDAISRSSSPIIAKIDDDDHYGAAYLLDAQQAMDYAGATFVSKGAVYTFLEARNATYLRRGDLVDRFYRGSPNGASMVFTRDLWNRIGFPDRTLGEDVGFSEAAARLGVFPYATAPWEFVYRRSSGGNTWDAVDELFLAGSTLAWEGDHPEFSDIPTP